MSVKNDRWSALSLKDRADLMNMYITNGISDLKEMKKHYNSFGDGGDIEQTLSGKPTLEEFIQSKVDSTRNAALEKSYTRVKGIEIPYELGEYEKNSVQRTLEYEEPYAAKFTYGPYTKNEEENIKTINYRLGRYYQAKKELEDNCKYGFNCIGTATDNYPKESRTVSNKDFEENFEKYGFQYIGMKNAKPGDIAKTPEHAMIYVGTDANGNPLFNYSDGGITEYNYKKDARYPAPYYGVYTYVGTPELIQQWTEEYNTNNSKKYGGKINSFSGEEDQSSNSTKQTFIENIVDKINATPEGNAKLKDIAYAIGVRAKERGRASLGNIIGGTIAGLAGNNTKHDDNVAAFIYGPESQGFETTNEKTFDYNQYIKDNYEGVDINKYKGIINNYGEYVIDKNQIDYIEKLISGNTPIYFDADLEYVEDVNNGNSDVRNSANIEMTPENEGRDDVKNYRISFRKDSKGNIVADATDLYDFENTSYSNKYTGSKSLQSRLLNKVGKPYILSQSGIPVRFVDYETLRKADWMTLDANQKRDLERAKLVNYFIEKSK